MGGRRFGFALANGAVGVYDNTKQLWSEAGKHKVTTLCAFDMTGDGQLELVVGRSDGAIEVRGLRRGAKVASPVFSYSWLFRCRCVVSSSRVSPASPFRQRQPSSVQRLRSKFSAADSRRVQWRPHRAGPLPLFGCRACRGAFLGHSDGGDARWASSAIVDVPPAFPLAHVLPTPRLAPLQADYRGEGVPSLLAVSVTGHVRGYHPLGSDTAERNLPAPLMVVASDNSNRKAALERKKKVGETGRECARRR